MSIHPVLLRALLTAVVAEMDAGQREALCATANVVRIAAEDRLVDDLIGAIAQADGGPDEVAV